MGGCRRVGMEAYVREEGILCVCVIVAHSISCLDLCLKKTLFITMLLLNRGKSYQAL